MPSFWKKKQKTEDDLKREEKEKAQREINQLQGAIACGFMTEDEMPARYKQPSKSPSSSNSGSSSPG